MSIATPTEAQPRQETSCFSPSHRTRSLLLICRLLPILSFLCMAHPAFTLDVAYTASIDSHTGRFSGSYLADPHDSRSLTHFTGVVFQKTNNAEGVYVGAV